MGVLPETGHALYEQGRPRDWIGQPVGAARGMSLHESKSLIIEMQACRSRAFLECAAPVMSDAFGGQGPALGAGNLHRLYIRVKGGRIRVEDDDGTLPTHVLMLLRLEKAPLTGIQA